MAALIARPPRCRHCTCTACKEDWHPYQDYGSDVSRQMDYAIRWQYSVSGIRQLLDEGVRLCERGYKGRSILHKVFTIDRKRMRNDGTEVMPECTPYHVDLVRALCEYGAFVNAIDDNGNTPLAYAARIGWVDAARVLLEYGAAPDSIAYDYYDTVLHRAVRTKNVEMIKLLLAYGARNCPDEDGVLPIMYAFGLDVISEGSRIESFEGGHDVNVHAVNAFLDAGIDVTRPLAPCGTTLLHCVAKAGCADLVRRLCAMGASPSACNANGDTPLHLARNGGNFHEDDIRALLEAGADANARNSSGETLFLHAVKSERCVPLIRCMMEYGARVTEEDVRHVMLHSHPCAAYTFAHNVYETGVYDVTQMESLLEPALVRATAMKNVFAVTKLQELIQRKKVTV